MKCFTRVALCILNGDASLRILSTDASGCFFINVTFIAVAEISIRGNFFKSYHKFSEFNLFFIHPILFWIDELIHLYSINISSMNIEFHLWYENHRRHFQIYLQWKCLNFNYNMYNFTEIIPKGPIDYKLALVQVVAWHQTGEKPLPESMLAQFNDAYIRH